MNNLTPSSACGKWCSHPAIPFANMSNLAGYCSARADFCGIFSFKDHLNLEFSHGATFLDPYGLLRGAGSLRRHIRLQQFSDIESKHVSYYIRIARQIADHQPLSLRPSRPLGSKIGRNILRNALISKAERPTSWRGVERSVDTPNLPEV
ncbi:hypothetical protein [Ochrobactrum sp. AN78]|uniref:hypothetical protein n=1 Tax=Ochrobactrum sp. AN78 TaxID=3039853 RepID=UPI002989E49E|nr:hypothetical protein [Ochrobactrum sp. AN78]MDH7792434.1 hypothetical protein [Ochrobactrum sp. AN78]